MIEAQREPGVNAVVKLGPYSVRVPQEIVGRLVDVAAGGDQVASVQRVGVVLAEVAVK